MPAFEEIRIQNFRNLGSVSIEPSPHLNILVGPNGAGKTSFMECLCVFAHGRSFRTHKYRHLVNKDSESFVLHGKFKKNKEEGVVPLGIQRFSNGKLEIRLNNENVKSASAVALQLPIVVITGESFKLLEAGPKERRKFFDWLVFHVKPEFALAWQQVVRCYKQRNTLLRRGKIDYQALKHWDLQISNASQVIDKARGEVFRLFVDSFNTLAEDHEEYQFLKGVSFKYINGWKYQESEVSYIDQLLECFERDIRLGYSTLGPQKADIDINQAEYKQKSKDILSRGQQKTLICTMYFALAKVYADFAKKDPMVIVDDLPAELDTNNQQYLGAWLGKVRSQVFVSGISESFFNDIWVNRDLLQNKVFHVEHGTIRE